ncbi:AlpA family transcriptional regulator [Acidovorax sp. sif0715]|nr:MULTISPECIES: AlpA family transcriptional regulator [unclassified Acidovorax]MBV7427027.1 AlpA family transcriptional regulator [Acidovorax sp. sif0732]MBV7448151.1 AlpA family transcriptional regulator [Acidovorax sp. sif0715]
MHSDTAIEPYGNRILRLPDAVKKTGLSKSGIYQRIRARTFPQPVRLGARAVGFVEREVDAFLSELMANRTHAEGAQR